MLRCNSNSTNATDVRAVGAVTVSTSPVKTGRQLVTMTGSMRLGDRELLRVHVAVADRLHPWFRPEHVPSQSGPKSGVAVIEGWMAFADDRPFDTLSLLLAADGFRPPVFHLDTPPGWVPTIELTAHIRAVPAPGPLRCRFHSEVIQNGFLQEDGEVWDSTGTLVVQSRQLALLPRG